MNRTDVWASCRWRWPLIGILLIGAWLLVLVVPVWRVRWYGARLSRRLPNRFVPKPFRVLPPPNAEYLGVWKRPPEAARKRLLETYGFTQQVRAYLHAYERAGTVCYERASCAYRPNGFTSGWQLHVRLFPTPTGETDVWCHWERNPNVAPLAHLRQDGYDPAEGKRRFLAHIAESEPLELSKTA